MSVLSNALPPSVVTAIEDRITSYRALKLSPEALAKQTETLLDGLLGYAGTRAVALAAILDAFPADAVGPMQPPPKPGGSDPPVSDAAAPPTDPVADPPAGASAG